MLGKNRTLRESETVPNRFFPLALAGCSVLVVSLVALTVVSNHRNRVAAEQERDAIRAAVSQEARSSGERLRAFAAVTPLSPPVAAYAAVDRIDFPTGFCRRDIGWREIAREA